jgi:hypothetical protein
MTSTQLAALSWAISELESAALDPEFQPRLSDLRDLLIEHTYAPYAYDASRTNLIQFMRKHGITIPNSEFNEWRIVLPEEQRIGMINALPESRGILRATNGILCYIERGDAAPYLGHLEFFQPEKSEVLIVKGGKPRAKSESEKYLSELFAGI